MESVNQYHQHHISPQINIIIGEKYHHKSSGLKIITKVLAYKFTHMKKRIVYLKATMLKTKGRGNPSNECHTHRASSHSYRVT